MVLIESFAALLCGRAKTISPIAKYRPCYPPSPEGKGELNTESPAAKTQKPPFPNDILRKATQTIAKHRRHFGPPGGRGYATFRAPLRTYANHCREKITMKNIPDFAQIPFIHWQNPCLSVSVRSLKSAQKNIRFAAPLAMLTSLKTSNSGAHRYCFDHAKRHRSQDKDNFNPRPRHGFGRNDRQTHRCRRQYLPAQYVPCPA